MSRSNPFSGTSRVTIPKTGPAGAGASTSASRSKSRQMVLPSEIAGTELARQKKIGLGIPAFVIGAIQNADQPMRMLAQHDVEIAPPFGSQHLAPITLAHGGDLVGKNDSALEQIQPAEILDARRLEIALRQIRQVEIEAPETPLLGEMMNREHGRKRQALVLHENRNERRRPIVDMEDLRRRRHAPRHFERRFAEENETRGVVFVGDTVFAVDARAIEKLVATDEECLDAAGRPAFHEFRDIILVADPHIDGDSRVSQDRARRCSPISR